MKDFFNTIRKKNSEIAVLRGKLEESLRATRIYRESTKDLMRQNSELREKLRWSEKRLDNFESNHRKMQEAFDNRLGGIYRGLTNI